VAIQCPAKVNSKKTSGGFKDLLKEKCPWHLEGNHTTEQCYQLRRALKGSPDPRPPHDKKGKKKVDEGNSDFQEPDKMVTSTHSMEVFSLILKQVHYNFVYIQLLLQANPTG
jgi:hypothetical protein